MKYNFKILKHVNKEEWNNKLLNSSYSTFFQSAEYITFEGNRDNNTPIFISIYDENKKIVAQLGLIIYRTMKVYSSQKLAKILKFISRQENKGIWTGGPIIFSENENEKEILKIVLDALDKLSKDEHLVMIGGYTPHHKLFNYDLIKLFENKKYKATKFFTFLMELKTSTSEIWEYLSKNAQRDVIRAQKRKFIVKELEYDTIGEYFKLIITWAKTKGIDAKLTKQFENEFWEYYQQGKEKIFLAYENDELVACHRLGLFNKIMYSHKIHNSYSKSGSLGGPLLTWHALEWASKNGIRIFDFSGGEAPPENKKNIVKYEKQWKSLIEYKRKWGGKEVEHYYVLKIIKPKSYKIERGLNKIDWFYRDYKHQKFKKPTIN